MPRRWKRNYRRRRPRRRNRRGVRKRGSLTSSHMRYGGKPTTMTVRGNTILPEKLRTVLPYADLVQVSTTTTGISKYVYRVNSIFDPDLSGTGYYPTGRDELAALYTNYTVFGIGYDITAINMSDTVPARVCVIGSGEDGTYATFQEAQSQPNASKPVILSTMDGGTPTAKLSGYISVAQCRGVRPATVSSDDLYSAAFGASPVNVAFFHILHANLDGVNTTDVHYEIGLKFYVRCTDLKQLTQTT